MAHAVLDVVAKYPRIEHVADEVHPPAVQELRGEHGGERRRQRQLRGSRAPLEKNGRNHPQRTPRVSQTILSYGPASLRKRAYGRIPSRILSDILWMLELASRSVKTEATARPSLWVDPQRMGRLMAQPYGSPHKHPSAARRPPHNDVSKSRSEGFP